MTNQHEPRHPRDLIFAALAGLEQGGATIGEGGGESGPPLYDATPQGWILGMETSFNDGVRLDQRDPSLLAHRYYVDHVGLGRKDALPMYLAALQAAGLEASLGPAFKGAAKQVVWLAGRYDSAGRRLG